MSKLTKTLVLTIALPDFYAEDMVEGWQHREVICDA